MPPSLTSNPIGVCIQLFADKIQKADINVPIATMTVAIKCIFLLTLPQPKSIIPKKEASKKNAVNTSYPNSGPMTFPTLSENCDQFRPNWYDITNPETTPIPNVTANILTQNW